MSLTRHEFKHVPKCRVKPTCLTTLELWIFRSSGLKSVPLTALSVGPLVRSCTSVLRSLAQGVLRTHSVNFGTLDTWTLNPCSRGSSDSFGKLWNSGYSVPPRMLRGVPNPPVRLPAGVQTIEIRPPLNLAPLRSKKVVCRPCFGCINKGDTHRDNQKHSFTHGTAWHGNDRCCAQWGLWTSGKSCRGSVPPSGRICSEDPDLRGVQSFACMLRIWAPSGQIAHEPAA
jgi:hypothetical protein